MKNYKVTVEFTLTNGEKQKKADTFIAEDETQAAFAAGKALGMIQVNNNKIWYITLVSVEVAE